MNKIDQVLACRNLADDYLCGRWQKLSKNCFFTDSGSNNERDLLGDFSKILISLTPAELLRANWQPPFNSLRSSLDEIGLRYCVTHLLSALNDLACGHDLRFDLKVQLFCIKINNFLKVNSDFLLVADVFLLPESFVSLSQSLRLFYAAHIRQLSGSFPQRMTVVLGMHRSGTSALTGLLGSVGISGPNDALGATENNLLGYWESTSLVTSADSFLSDQNSHWSQLYRWSSCWWKSTAFLSWMSTYWQKMHEVYDFDTHFVLKDPRLCILMEGMIPCLVESLVHIDFLLILRSPVEVVISLRKAEGVSLREALNLWIGSVLRSEVLSRPYSRRIFTYPELLASPQAVVDSCGELLGKSFMEPQLRDAQGFITPSLYRTKIDSVRSSFLQSNPDLVELLCLAEAIYHELQESRPNVPTGLGNLNLKWLEILAAN